MLKSNQIIDPVDSGNAIPSANSLKVLQVGMHERGAGGGVERIFWGLYDELAGDPSLEVDAFFFRHRAGEMVVRPREVCLGSTQQPGYRRLWTLRRQVFSKLRSFSQADSRVVATHFAFYAAALLPQLSRLNHVVHFHGPWAAETAVEGRAKANVVMKRLMEKKAYAAAKKFITLSEAFKDILVQDYRMNPERVQVIPGGVDLNQFTPGNREEARERLGWPRDVPIFLCVRRLVRRMGLEALVDAFAAIAAKSPDVILMIGGRGPLQSELEAKIARLNLAPRVRLLGFVPESELALAYRAANLSVVPSQFLEGFGLAVIESLACGTPALVSPVGGLPETVRGLDPRLIASDQSAPALADWMSLFLEGEIKPPSTEMCRRHVEANFSWPVIAQQVRAVYRRVVCD
jgi:glycosyltransferase involved in cell wall biosynthesis